MIWTSVMKELISSNHPIISDKSIFIWSNKRNDINNNYLQITIICKCLTAAALAVPIFALKKQKKKRKESINITFHWFPEIFEGLTSIRNKKNCSGYYFSYYFRDHSFEHFYQCGRVIAGVICKICCSKDAGWNHRVPTECRETSK